MEHQRDDVVPCSATDTEEVARILGRAFADDPVIGWMFGSADRQSVKIQQAFEVWVRRVFGPKQAVELHSSRHSAACWAPPARWKLTLTQRLRLLPSMAHIFGVPRLSTVLSGMQLMADSHPDDREHWYLGFVGTEPQHHGRGLGSALLRHGLKRCDDERMPAYLEASRSENVPFYERFGFVVREQFELPDGPPVWGMWREPEALM